MKEQMHTEEQSLQTFTEFVAIPSVIPNPKITIMDRTFSSISNHLTQLRRQVCKTDQRDSKLQQETAQRTFSKPDSQRNQSDRNEFLQNCPQNFFDLSKANHNHIRVYRTMNNLYKKSRINMPLRRLESVFATQKILKENDRSEKQFNFEEDNNLQKQYSEKQTLYNAEIEQQIVQQDSKGANPTKALVSRKVYSEEIQEQIVIEPENKIQASSSSKTEWLKAQVIIRNLQALIK